MHYLQKVLQPLIFGKSAEQSRLDKLEILVTELQQNVVTALTKVQETLTASTEHRQQTGRKTTGHNTRYILKTSRGDNIIYLI